jgi:hypothetical protein
MQALIILEHLLRKMSTKELRNSIPMQPINNLDLLIELPNILRALVLRNLNIDIPLHDELTPMLQLVQLAIDTIQ